MLPAAAQAAGQARQRTREALTSWELGQMEEPAVLLVSELVGNAVRHARPGASGLQLRLAATRRCLRIEVTDADPRPPQPRAPAGMDESGFGFVLVDALATNWGVDHAAVGKTVWIELAIGQPGKQGRKLNRSPARATDTGPLAIVQREAAMAAHTTALTGPASCRGR
jgi:anti-sigma regulatory factor (Ser/Thr protein kinase)